MIKIHKICLNNLGTREIQKLNRQLIIQAPKKLESLYRKKYGVPNLTPAKEKTKRNIQENTR